MSWTLPAPLNWVCSLSWHTMPIQSLCLWNEAATCPRMKHLCTPRLVITSISMSFQGLHTVQFLFLSLLCSKIDSWEDEQFFSTYLSLLEPTIRAHGIPKMESYSLVTLPSTAHLVNFPNQGVEFFSLDQQLSLAWNLSSHLNSVTFQSSLFHCLIVWVAETHLSHM